ncbi:aldehyde reductase [soil metagenome]
MVQTVFVTGGSGFVGGWCIVTLLRRGYDVRATLRSLSKADAVRAMVATQVDPGDRLTFAQADLMSDAGWDAAMAGIDHVLHVASPLGGEGQSVAALVGPARDGTIRVLAAATRAGVKRIVVTSSCAAATPLDQSGESVSDETTWTDAEDPKLNAYRKSKAIAEWAAWDWMEANDDPARLTTILPAAIFGPVLSREAMSSVALIQGLLNGRPPAVPRVSFNVVDVRDVAEAHVLALTTPEAAGQRFIAAGEFLWMKDVAAILRDGLGAKAGKVPRRIMPDVLVRLIAIFVPPMRALTPIIGRRHSFDGRKAGQLLGLQYRPARDTILDCARSLGA